MRNLSENRIQHAPTLIHVYFLVSNGVRRSQQYLRFMLCIILSLHILQRTRERLDQIPTHDGRIVSSDRRLVLLITLKSVTYIQLSLRTKLDRKAAAMEHL